MDPRSIITLLALIFIFSSCGNQPEEKKAATDSVSVKKDIIIKKPQALDTFQQDFPKQNYKTAEQLAEIEMNLQKFVAEGYEIYTFETGMLDNDTIEDVVMILAPLGEDSLSTPENLLKRETLILTGNNDGSYKVEGRNFNVAYPYHHDWNFIDCFAELHVGKGTFSIGHYGGGEPRWSRGMAFKYHPIEDNWFLERDEFSHSSVTELEKEFPGELKTPKDFGKVKFEDASLYK